MMIKLTFMLLWMGIPFMGYWCWSLGAKKLRKHLKFAFSFGLVLYVAFWLLIAADKYLNPENYYSSSAIIIGIMILISPISVLGAMTIAALIRNHISNKDTT